MSHDPSEIILICLYMLVLEQSVCFCLVPLAISLPSFLILQSTVTPSPPQLTRETTSSRLWLATMSSGQWSSSRGGSSTLTFPCATISWWPAERLTWAWYRPGTPYLCLAVVLGVEVLTRGERSPKSHEKEAGKTDEATDRTASEWTDTRREGREAEKLTCGQRACSNYYDTPVFKRWRLFCSPRLHLYLKYSKNSNTVKCYYSLK